MNVKDVRENWDPEFGDRHTQFVIIGTDLDQEALTKSLDECLLTTEEYDQDWSQLPEPYGWQITQA